MQSLGLSDAVLLTVLLTVSFVFFYPQNRAFRRRGIDPGVLGLKIWPARVWFLLKGHEITQKAYREAKDFPYLLQTLVDDILILPPRFLPELQLQPGTKLSASHALVSSVLGQYSGVDIILTDRQANNITRTQLTRSLPVIIPPIAEKVDSILSERLSECTLTAFTPIKVKDLVTEIVLRTTLLTFVGPDLAENAELQNAVSEFSSVVRDTAICLLFVPKFMRPWVHPFLPPNFRMRRLHVTVRRILFSSLDSWNKDCGFPTIVQHFVATSKELKEEEIISKLLTLIAAALHTLTMSTIHALIDLCASPQYISDLREEVSRSLYTDNNDGAWRFDDIYQFRRFDAFLKESQRFNPPNYISFDRLVMDSMTLSDGTKLCKGQLISMPAAQMAMDPEFYEHPQSFDISRFLPHESSTSDGKSIQDLEFVDIEKGNVHWGAGRFTCPGRWYASAVMKIIIGSIIIKYDIMFPEGQKERLPNVYLDIVIEANPKQKILFQSRY